MSQPGTDGINIDTGTQKVDRGRVTDRMGTDALFQQAREIYESRTRVNCTRCGYCMPCPSGVDIPGNFLQLNNLAIYGDRGAAEFFYFHILKDQQRASNCQDCGQCEELCPQQIPIRQRLAEVVQEFERRTA